MKGDAIELNTGALTPLEIDTILKNLPVDVTFVGKDDTVRYFSLGNERFLQEQNPLSAGRYKTAIPRTAFNFKSSKHSTAEFWLELNGAFIHIRYLALRDENGEYLGTMEVSQDLIKVRALEGERRLLQYKKE